MSLILFPFYLSVMSAMMFAISRASRPNYFRLFEFSFDLEINKMTIHRKCCKCSLAEGVLWLLQTNVTFFSSDPYRQRNYLAFLKILTNDSVEVKSGHPKCCEYGLGVELLHLAHPVLHPDTPTGGVLIHIFTSPKTKFRCIRCI